MLKCTKALWVEDERDSGWVATQSVHLELPRPECVLAAQHDSGQDHLRPSVLVCRVKMRAASHGELFY